MRNLKKILALVLAVMMVLSVMVTASAAFVDEDKITNKEAVTVMSELGILTGKGDAVGFDPEGILNRAEAAVMLTKAMLGVYWSTDLAATVDALNNPFTDVAASHWGVDYIMFAYDQGLIIGDGKGHFDPKAELTGYAFGKMLLIAAGAAKAEDFTATGWMKTVADKLAKLGWADNLDITLSKPLNREDAAEMLFQAMQYSPIVKSGYPVYEVATEEIVGYYDTLVEAAAAASVLNSGLASGVTGTINAEFTYGYTKVNYGGATMLDGWYVSAGADADVFERPLVANWYSALHADYIYTEMDAPVAEYTDYVTDAKVYSDLKLTPVKAAASAFYYYIDGEYQGTLTIDDVASYYLGATGTLTQVFYMGKISGVYTYVVTEINTYVAEIDEWTAAAYNTVSQQLTHPYITLNDFNGALTNLDYVTYDYSEADEDNDLIGKEGTIVLYNRYYVYANGADTYKVAAVETAKTAQVTVSQVINDAYGNLYAFVADGVTYYAAANFYSSTGVSYDTSVINANNKYNLWFDVYGNVIRAELVGAAANAYGYGIVVDAAKSGDVWASGADSYQVKIVTASGEIITVPTDAASYAAVVSGETFTMKAVKYTIDAATGKYIFNTTAQTVGAADDDFSVKTGVAQVVISDSVTVVANSKTVFYVGTTGADRKISWKTYTGIANAPAIEDKTTGTYVVALKADGTVATNGDVAVAIVVLDAQSSTAAVNAKDVAYLVYNPNAALFTDASGSYYIYTAQINGVTTSIKVKADAVSEVFGNGALVTNLISEKGLVVDSTIENFSGLVLNKVSGVVEAKPAYGVIYIDGAAYAVADNCVYNYVYHAAGSITPVSAEYLEKAPTAYPVTYVDALIVNGVITTVYFYYGTAI